MEKNARSQNMFLKVEQDAEKTVMHSAVVKDVSLRETGKNLQWFI